MDISDFDFIKIHCKCPTCGHAVTVPLDLIFQDGRPICRRCPEVSTAHLNKGPSPFDIENVSIETSIEIEVEGGCVTDVHGLPAGMDYTIDDHDILE